ncbi:acyclic terpene utilization AtuA family protein [Pigmentiphaga soli]
MDEIRFIAATGSLGSGVAEDWLTMALAHKPHFIAADAGTTDAGAFFLGSGKTAYTRSALKRDLEIVLQAAQKVKVPVLIGSSGTAGADVHVELMLELAGEIAAEHAMRLKVATIFSEQDKDYLTRLHGEERIRALYAAPEIDSGTFRRSTRVVGMMGVEPLQEALKENVDLILAGRCSDPALYAAMPIMLGFPEGLAWHAGKVAECGTQACTQPGRGVLCGTVRRDEFIIRACADSPCTPQSIAAHSLYENGDPYLHKEASGMLDLSQAQYFEAENQGVRVTGSLFAPAEQYTVKLEGAALAGYQSIVIGGVRDPYIIRQLDDWLGKIEQSTHASVAQLLGDQLKPGDYSLTFHIYGRNAIMGKLEPVAAVPPHEVGIVLEATAPTQEFATAIAKFARQPLLHQTIPEWRGSITGFACLHNPAEIERGPVWRFNLNHVAVPRTKAEMFRTRIQQVGATA